VTRAFFNGRAALETRRSRATSRHRQRAPADAARALSSDLYFNALLRTTCVATMVSAGHARNALQARDRKRELPAAA
jgi:hypothetical protein